MDFVFYMGDVFTPINFGLLLLGTVGGLILGATPGLSPTMAVALLIPFTFQLILLKIGQETYNFKNNYLGQM